jgi:LCP family protein required for cell wall assembly
MPTVEVSDDVVHILLIGVDWEEKYHGRNTDTMIVAAVNKDTKQVSMLSIPRDLWVYIPTYGWNRINTAHKRGESINYPGGGAGLLMETIRVNLGIVLDHWILVNLDGFRKAIDELGGVEVTVACPVNLRYHAPQPDDPDQEEQILEPGVHHLDGATALKYVRTRRGASDFDRARRQQQFIKVLWKQLRSPEILTKIPGLWSVLKDAYETDLKLGDVLGLAPLALQVRPQHIRNVYIGPQQTTHWITHNGAMVLLPRSDQIQQAVASLYAPPSAREDQASDEGARLQVRNGTYRHQLAKIGAEQITWLGLDVIDTGLADHPNYEQTRIIIYNDKPKTVDLLARELKVTTENVVHYQQGIGLPDPDLEQQPDIMVILGNDYDPCK